ncbi:helix-turn-helix transcriptional regulator, partial [uncultured Parabacteroides sp.]
EEQYKRSQQYIEDNEKQISQLTEMFHTKQKEMSEVEKQLYEARKLMLEMENRQIFEKQGTIQLLEKDFHNSSLYIRIHREDDIQLSPSEWEELHQLIDATYPDFTNRLIKLYTQISIEEIHICYLVKMQLPIKKIAFIMHITSSGVSQCRRRLYKKFTGEPQNTEKFDKFITDF